MPKKSEKKDEKMEKLSKTELQTAMATLTDFTTQIDRLKDAVKEHLDNLKERGVNVAMLKKVVELQESEHYEAFLELWNIYEQKEDDE